MPNHSFSIQVQEVPDPVPSPKTMREIERACREWEARQPGRKFTLRDAVTVSARSAIARKKHGGAQ